MAQQSTLIGSTGFKKIGDWLNFDEPGRIRLSCGKVELGQGILTALAQIAATELHVAMARVFVVSGDTRLTPNEGYTGASLSIEVSGLAVLRAAISARRLLLAEAARLLNIDVESLDVADGAILHAGQATGLDVWRLAQSVDPSAEVDQGITWANGDGGGAVGKSVPRIDLNEKLMGGGFIQDIELPGMLHGRVLRPPSFKAHLVALDDAAVAASGAKVWRDGSFVAVVAEREYDAVRALACARALAVWREQDTLPAVEHWDAYLANQPAIESTSETGARSLTPAALHLSASYSKPPIAHASLAPSCGLAQWKDGKLTVWSSTQGVFNLRGAIAIALQIPVEDIAVIHCHGAGCYGHNGAEDAAMDAVLLARAYAPAPVRVQWSREDELSWAPFGSPMAVRVSAGLTEAGRISNWRAEVWSGTHVKRPGFLPGLVDFLATDFIDSRIPFSDPRNVSHAFAGADRNADPPYAVPHVEIVRHYLPDLPLRLSSLRALGAFANVFAAESFMDELAELADQDPIAFRLQHLHDPRARRVLEAAAALAEWRAHAPLASGHAQGVGFARYKNTAAYAAVIAEVELDDAVRVKSLIGAVDAGRAINPDGLLNQIEGGAIQAASWTLCEEVTFDKRMILSNSWETYPILGFDAAPRVKFQIVGGDENDPLGVGEASLGPTAAAIGNAVARALGFRVRDLPISRSKILQAR